MNPWEQPGFADGAEVPSEEIRERVGQLQSDAQQGGLMSMVGFMLATAVVPAAAKQGARLALTRLGKASRSAEALGRAIKASSRVSTADARIREQAMRLQYAKMRTGERVRAAAAQGVEEAKRAGSSFDLSRLAARLGWGTPERLREGGGAWRQFRESEAVRRQGLSRAFLNSRSQRKLISSAWDAYRHEQLAVLPIMYGLDSAAGITAPPGEIPAFYDLPGHAANFITWLPRYAAFDVGSRLALSLPGSLMKMGSRALERHVQGAAPQIAEGLSRAYMRIEQGRTGLQRGVSHAENIYRRHTGASPTPVNSALNAAREIGARAARAVGKRRGPYSYDIGRDAALQGARNLFHSRFDQASAFERAVARLQKDSTDTAAVDHLFRTAFVDAGGERSPGYLAGKLGLRAATLADVEPMLGRAAREQTDQLRRQINAAKHRILDSTRKYPDNVRSLIESMDPDRLRVSGYAKLGGRTMRMGTGAEWLHQAASAIDRATTLLVPGVKSRPGASLFQILQGHTLTDTRPTIKTLHGALDIDDGRLHYFGREKGPLPTDHLYDLGFAVTAPGSRRVDIYGAPRGRSLRRLNQGGPLLTVGGVGSAKLKRVRMRRHYRQGQIQSEKDRVQRALRGGMAHVSDWLGFGHSSPGLRRAKSLFGKHTPRRLFATDSELWSIDPSNIADRGERAERLMDAAFMMRQAGTSINAGEVYTHRQLFARALDNLSGGGFDAARIIDDDEAALEAARKVLATDRAGLRGATSPTAAHAKAIIRNVDNNPDYLYNTTGEKRGQILRRFLFEQGVMGGGGRPIIREMMDDMDDLVRAGTLKEDAVLEAQAGMVFLETQLRFGADTGARMRNPYEYLDRRVAGVKTEDFRRVARAVSDTAGHHRQRLERFAASRPRVDLGYHRKAFTEVNLFGAPFDEEDFFAVTPSLGGITKMYWEAGLDTSREALSTIGLGWDPRLPFARGSRETPSVLRIWGRRAGAFAGLYMGYQALDTATDVLIPDGLPGSEGITSNLADVAAGSRLSAAYVYDKLGITDAAKYMEGLMPKSTSILPGAALGFYAARWKGALLGAAVGRMMHETFRDTPMEALSAVPILAPFVSDVSEDFEEVRAKYEGNALVPIRKGRFFMLSTSDFSGGRITQWRPNWYRQAKNDVQASPVLFGSELEKFIHKNLPLIDFSIGDIYDPQFLTRKHYYDRPYFGQDVPFADMPLVGPAVSATLGRAYLAFHPLGSNRPMHLNSMVGQFEGEGLLDVGPDQITGAYHSALVGGPLQGTQRMTATGGDLFRDAPNPYATFARTGTIVSSDSTRAVLDTQFYRISEAMGFTGFLLQQAAGGEGIFQDAVMSSASEMNSAGRFYHDMQMGDLLGVGEAMRRLYPFQRNVDTLGPRNTMPRWMPDDFEHGDPYCLLPETLMELDGELIEAKEAYRRVLLAPEEHTARTHTAREKPVLAAARRLVDEEVVSIEMEGLPYRLAVTTQHPLLVLRQTANARWEAVWELAGRVREGDLLAAPVGPASDRLVTYDAAPIRGRHSDFSLPHDAVTTEGLLALLKVQPPAHASKYLTYGLASEDCFQLDRAFGLGGCKYAQREKVEIAELRRTLAEEGLPRSIVGMSAGALRPFVYAWGKAIEGGIELRLTKERLGLSPRPEWKAKQPYVPKTPPDTALSRTAHTLMQAFHAAGTPAELALDGEDYLLRLRGMSAARYLLAEVDRRRARHLSGEDRLLTVSFRRGEEQYTFVRHAITRIDRFHYEGPVYAFEVDEDSSFVAAGVVTHNSKIAKGEALLPGAGFEMLFNPVGERELSVGELATDEYGTALRMLGVMRKVPSEKETWAKQQLAQQLIDIGTAVRTSATFVDERTRLIGVAAAATRGGQPIHIEALSDAEFRASTRLRSLDREKINALVGAAKQTRGMVAYVNEDTGETQMFVHQFDSGLYNKTVQKLSAARSLAKEYDAMGYGAPGAMYSTVDRLQVLLNTSPFSQEWRVEMRKAKALSSAGAMSMREEARFRDLASMHKKMSLPFEIYQERFGMDQLLDPDGQYYNLTYNDNIRAAANYSLPERLAGSIWETWSNLRTPLHSKFFGAYDLEHSYENRVILSRDFQSWSDPVQDFVKPYLRGLVAAHDPLQGALSYGLGGLTFGGPMFGALGAAVGSIYGAAHGGLRMATDYQYIPGQIEDRRELGQQFDRIRYYRAKRLYDATHSKQFLDEMQRSAYGWTQEGLARRGWAKQRRQMYGPSNSLDSPLYATDQGFGSPWKGLKRIAKFKDALLKHRGSAYEMRPLIEGGLPSAEQLLQSHRFVSQAEISVLTSRKAAGVTMRAEMAERRLREARGSAALFFGDEAAVDLEHLYLWVRRRRLEGHRHLAFTGDHYIHPLIQQQGKISRKVDRALELKLKHPTNVVRHEMEHIAQKYMAELPDELFDEAVDLILGEDLLRAKLLTHKYYGRLLDTPFQFAAELGAVQATHGWGVIPELDPFGRRWRQVLPGRLWKDVEKVAAQHQDVYLDAMSGLSHGGTAQELRAQLTRVRSNRGFGSPWRGEDALAALAWRFDDPTMQPYPSELLTMFPAAPRPERDFTQALLLQTDPDRQEEILRMVSPDMASMLDVAWNYLYGQPMRGDGFGMDAMGHLDMGLSSHPIMGLGAYEEGYRIRTLEDMGMDAHDMGLGWKSQLQRMDAAFFTPTSAADFMQEAAGVKSPDTNQLTHIIKGALAQMGLVAEVSIQETSSPSEIHFTQTT